MSLLYKDIDPELLGYGSDNNKKPLPSKEQRNLADAVSANSSAASTEEAGGAMNNFRFAQKGVVEGVLGAPVDAIGGLINEARAGYSAFQGGMANLAGKPEDHTPLKPIDFSSAFGGTESFKSGFENIGAPVIDRDPQTTGEKASYIIGENSNLLPVGRALNAVKSGINASRTMSMVPAGDNGAPPEIDRLADEPNYLQDRFPSPSSTPSPVSNATAPSGELNEAATLAMNPAGFPVAAPVAAPAPAPAPVTQGQPNLSAVPGTPTDAAAPVAQPNLDAVQPAAPQGPQGPQKGDLIGSYLGKDGSNIGVFEGMPSAPITAEQLAGLDNRMDAGGMPVVSSTNAPGLMRAFDSQGNVQFADPEQANAMNATYGDTIRAEKAAQQRAINSDYMRERGNAAIRNMQANAPINYYDQASREAQESIANRPDFSQAFSGVGSAGVSSGGASRDGGYRGGSSEDKPSDFGDARPSQNVPSDVRTALSIPARDRTAKQNKRVAAWEVSTQGKEMGGAAGYAESQMTPQEKADQQLERNKVQAQIDSYKNENPDKYQQATGIINELLEGGMYKNLSTAQKSEVKSLMMLQYMGVDAGETDFGPEINAILHPKPEDPSADSSTDPTDPNA